MLQDLLAQFMVERSACDRRAAALDAPPYLTEEGMVLIDRRDGSERRAASWRQDDPNSQAQQAAG